MLWGEGPHKRTPKKEKESKASKDFCKDLTLNFVFLCFSLVPLAVAVYFVATLNHHLSTESNWLPDCDADK